MKLYELAAKLLAKPDQEIEVEFLVLNKDTDAIVCCDLTGPNTIQLMKALSRNRGGQARVD